MNKEDQNDLIHHIRNSVIGANQAIEGPFGYRRVTYADYTASGRSLTFIEDFIRLEVMPLYANTHTETSTTGLQTTTFREDARAIIKEAVGGSDDDVVIFCGSGATGAINTLISVLGLRIPDQLNQQYKLIDQIPENERPVVFIGPYEHHSNELPWRETIADVVMIDEDEDGRIDPKHLDRELKRFAERPLKIGAFSAASNVTGIVSDTYGISALLHKYGAIACWDFAAAGPYINIEMNPPCERQSTINCAKDAVFLSPHKFIGGPQTPGILVAKKKLFTNRIPSTPGGGTVAYVNHLEHAYHPKPEIREEGGTPEIIGSIRAGLVFALKNAVSARTIEALEETFLKRALKIWKKNPNIKILGSASLKRLSIISFTIRFRQQFLHHNYVVALLNDLFGIQARGGCSCAGPYGHRLLGIDLVQSREFEKEILSGCEGIKPGWVRVNFNYFISEKNADFIIEAVNLIANEGYKLLPQYVFDPQAGTWHHHKRSIAAKLRLHHITFSQGRLEYRSEHRTEPELALAEYLNNAKELFATIKTPRRIDRALLSEDFEKLRWFPLPHEIEEEQTL